MSEGCTNPIPLPTRKPPAQYVRNHYRGGGILYDDTLPNFIIQAHLNMRDYVLDGTLWSKALRDPTQYAEWVVMQPARWHERVSAALLGNQHFINAYQLKFEADEADRSTPRWAMDENIESTSSKKITCSSRCWYMVP